MNRYAAFLLTAAIILLAPILFAEEGGHFCIFPTGSATWTIGIEKLNKKKSSTGGNLPQESEVQQMNIIREGNLRRDILVWTDGSKTESWISLKPPVVMSEAGKDKKVVTMKTSDLAGYRFDETNFSWVGPNTFKKFDKFNDKQCRVYETQVEVVDGEKQTLRAWIDNETGKPLAWDNGIILASFSFAEDPPTEPLVLPEKFREALNRVQAYYAPPVTSRGR